MNLLNKAQADALFQREAVLFGSIDTVPMFRAVELFGSDAVERTQKYSERGRDWSCWGTVDYFTLSGFRGVVSRYNERQLNEAAARPAAPAAQIAAEGRA